MSVPAWSVSPFLHNIWILLSGVWLQSKPIFVISTLIFLRLCSGPFSFFSVYFFQLPQSFPCIGCTGQDWYTAVFTELLWVLVKRRETSLSLLGPHSHKCLRGCFAKVWERERPHSSSNPLKCCFWDRFADQFSEPRGANPCSYAPRKTHGFWSWWYLRFMQANCATCWFVLGIRCSTGFEMKTFAYFELLANLSLWRTGFLSVFPLVSLPNPLSELAH